jgi:hypothetical protein
LIQRAKPIFRYLLAYLALEASSLFWRLLQQIIVNKVAVYILAPILIFIVGWVEYRLLFSTRSFSERRDLLINLAIMGISLAIMFIGFCYGYAFILNRRGYYDRHRLFFEYFQTDPELGYIAKPNLVNLELAWSLGNIRAVPHSTDEFGYRADGSRYGVPIAVVGDSFGFGAWVAAENTWAEKLEDDLAISVTNYSAPGYSLWQYSSVKPMLAAFNIKLLFTLFLQMTSRMT